MTIRSQALPELVDAWAALVAQAADAGIGIAIADFGGFRTAADTSLILGYKTQDYNAYAAREWAAGRIPVPITGPWENGSNRPILPYGQSYHDFGAARDFTITSRPADMSLADAVAAVDNLAEWVGLTTGRGYGDPWHVELDITLEQAKVAWQAAGDNLAGGASMTAVWLLVAVGVGAVVAVRYAAGLRAWR